MNDLTSKLHIGDHVELSVDGQFFERTDKQDEKYAGYVITLTQYVIGLSVTHPSNRHHGYNRLNNPPSAQHVVEIESVHVKNHKVL